MEEVSAADKIRYLTQTMRKLWPKYDQALDQQITQKQKILQFIEHIFENTNLSNDLAYYENDPENVSVEGLIYRISEIDPNEYRFQNYAENLMEIDENLALNQVQILNIIKSIYANDLKNE